MSQNARFAPALEPLEPLCLPALLDPVNAALADVVATAQAAVPDEVPALLDTATPEGAVGLVVEPHIDPSGLVPLPLTSAPLLPSDVVGLLPPVQTELIQQAVDAVRGLDPTGLVPPLQSDLLAQGLQLGQVGLTEPQRVGVVAHDLYPADADVYVGFLRVPDSGTGVPVGFLPLLNGDLGVKTDAIEADLGGAGLEV